MTNRYFRNSRKLIVPFLLVLFFNSCKTTKPTIPKQPPSDSKVEEEISPRANENVPEPLTEQPSEENTVVEPPLNIAEFRAAWIATVANINWPSAPGLSSEKQKKEALHLLGILEKQHFNAVILQVRPQADAFYKSSVEPWSYYLTGKNGKAPEPFYDPLEFWISEAHKRGMELHVWLNPYRAHHTTAGEIGEKSIVKNNPEMVVELKNGMWWMDPGNEKVQDRSAAVVMDIVKRYNIDGVHFDDYFYPYASYNGKKDFPDDKSWLKYLNAGGQLSRGDWRRKNVNDFIQRVADEIKAEKSYVKFGISPFGIWRPDIPEGIKGMDQYEELYADAKLWLNKGWIDYFTPQLYWPTKQIGQSFPVLLGWWQSENVTSRHLWPGINLSLEENEETKGEIASQIMISRGVLRDDPGTVHWNIGPLTKNNELVNSLKNGPYRKNALVPSSPWLDDETPLKPILDFTNHENKLGIEWKHANPADVFRWVVYFKYEDSPWDYKIMNKSQHTLEIPAINMEDKKLEKVGITAVDRTGNQSSFQNYNIENLVN